MNITQLDTRSAANSINELTTNRSLTNYAIDRILKWNPFLYKVSWEKVSVTLTVTSKVWSLKKKIEWSVCFQWQSITFIWAQLTLFCTLLEKYGALIPDSELTSSDYTSIYAINKHLPPEWKEKFSISKIKWEGVQMWK